MHLTRQSQKLKLSLNGNRLLTERNYSNFWDLQIFTATSIGIYSQIASPLTKFTYILRPFSWSSEAQTAFDTLKKSFVTVHILIQPDTTHQFIVKVNISDSSVGAVLSQKESSGKLKPCAFFSEKFSHAEQNYDMGNHELLAIKLALEGWRHWLEWPAQSFIVCTDHRNLAYLRSAKRLNARQARWCLFFDRFDFTITYRPGSRNIKPDALSHQFNTSDHSTDSTIIPTTCIIGNLTWEIETRVLQGQGEEPQLCTMS